MKLVTIFSEIYDFCKELKGKSMMDQEVKRNIRSKKLDISEVITIQVCFFISGYKTFKDFYIREFVEKKNQEFPNAPSYTRFLELKNEALEMAAMCALYKNQASSEGTAFMLRNRGLVESVGNILKNSLSLKHSRHRSVKGCFMHIFCCLIAYAFKENKPSLFQPTLQIT